MGRRDLHRLANGVLVPGWSDAAMPGWLADELGDGLGGVCWFGRDPGSLLHDTHAARSGALVLSDEEGGNVTRLESAAGSSWPGNAALGVLDDVAATERVGAGIGALARRAGVDVVLAPVVDVNSDPHNPVIGVRSFGAEPGLVGRQGAAFTRGVQGQGVAACAKHFPGHGATHTDSHVSLPVVDDDRATIIARDVAPFVAAIEAGVRCVLTAHVSMPAVDATPATMSAPWLSMLRDQLGFDGVVMTDALDMHAISRGVGRRMGAVAALRAGVDLIGIGNPDYPEPYDAHAVLVDVRQAIVDAIERDELPIARLQQAGERLATLNDWLTSQRGDDQRDPDLAFGREVARRAIRAVGDVRITGPPLVVTHERDELAAGRRASTVAAALSDAEPDTGAVIVSSPDDVGQVGSDTSGRRVVLVTDALDGGAMVQAVRAIRPDAIVVHTGPPVATGEPSIDAPAVFALGTGAANAAVVAELLLGPTVIGRRQPRA